LDEGGCVGRFGAWKEEGMYVVVAVVVLVVVVVAVAGGRHLPFSNLLVRLSAL